MFKDKPFIKLFKTSNNCYMYDVNKNTILNINEEIYQILDNILHKQDSEYDAHNSLGSIKRLKSEGYLSSNRVKVILQHTDELVSFYLENRVKMLTLQVTQQCNFRCEYCIYSGSYINREHSNKKMDISMAKKGIDFLIRNSKDCKDVILAFYGGEPLLEFKFVKQCIEYAEEKSKGKKINFHMTTNGSLLNDEIINFLVNHDVSLTISLDGPKEVHDEHRKFASSNIGTFDKIIDNIIYIGKKYPEYSKKLLFNAVLDSENDFSCVDKFFINSDTVKDMNMMSSLKTDNYSTIKDAFSEDFYIKREYELFNIFVHLIREMDLSNCSKIIMQDYNMLVKFSEALMPTRKLTEKYHPGGPCMPGAQRLFMNADGFFFPCERVSESSEIMKIGHVDTGFDQEKVRKILNIGKVNEDACKNCWAIRFCDVCAASIDDTNGLSPELKAQCCQRVKSNVEEKMKNYCVLREFGHDFNTKQYLTDFS